MALGELQSGLVEDLQPEKEAKISQSTTKQDTEIIEKGDIVFSSKYIEARVSVWPTTIDQ